MIACYALSMIITIANSKGGVGKSTLAVHLAAWLYEQGHRVTLADCDTQQSSSEWIREAVPQVKAVRLDNPDVILNELPLLAGDTDFVVADGPGSQTETSRALLLRADLAIVPCKASMLEVRALAKATEVLRVSQDIRAGMPKAIIVLSMVGKNYRLTKDMRDGSADITAKQIRISLVDEDGPYPIVAVRSVVVTPAHANHVLDEIWSGISGLNILNLANDPNFYGAPTSTGTLNAIAATNLPINSGIRVRGYITANATGDTVFTLNSDGGTFYLSSDNTPDNKSVLITGPNVSGHVQLQAGERYYFEFLKQTGAASGSNFSVNWGGGDLAYYLDPYTAPTVGISTGVSTAEVGTSITFQSSVTDPSQSDGFQFVWTVLKNGSPFAVGSDSTLTFVPNAPGSYSVSLVVTDAQLATMQSATKTLQVVVAKPINPVIASVTDRSMTISWCPPIIHSGITGFSVYRNGVQIGILDSIDPNFAGTFQYTDTNLTPESIYNYTLRSRDAQGSESADSVAVHAKTKVDMTLPSAPLGLAVSTVGSSSVSLSWAGSTDNVGVAGYNVYRGSVLIATTAGLNYSDVNLSSSTSFSYAVRAYDAAGNLSPASNTATVTTKLAPPTNLAASVGAQSIILTWASVNSAAGYDIYRNGALAGSVNTASLFSPSYADDVTPLSPETTYTYTVRARDNSGYQSGDSVSVTLQTLPDGIPPTAPGTPSLADRTTSSITLSWNASSDNVGVVGYRVYRSYVAVGFTTTTSYTDTGLTPGTTYNFYVEAYDAHGNVKSGGTASLATVTQTTPTTD